ncbi:MAG TPA: polyisoprenoid-binding protein [Gammaproteobacteria bacterium]|mgnify:FL=1|jgi:polyisoprenoid-binding protein YceI|nr:polyisoprenoid-binding protein [Gammaproteobacteria bacterium]HIL63531.1 polyisoprenoid-binding protein [Porticoccaceae bacterium]
MFIRLFKKHYRLSLVLVCSVLLVSCDRLLTPDFNTEITELRAGQYTIDSDHASVLWKINHLGFSTFIGRFNDIEASLDFDPENIENSSVEVIINTAGLDINNPEFAEELRGSNWFDVENFPQAVYRTTSFLESNENTFVFEGELTLLGVTAPVTLNVVFNGGGRNFLTRKYTLGFSGSANFQRSVFGLSRFTSFGVGDDIDLEIHIEFQDLN